MILVCGVLADAMVELMCARLQDMGLSYLFLDQVSFPGRFGVSWEVAGGRLRGYVRYERDRVELDDLTGVYVRYVSYRGAPQAAHLSGQERELAEAEYQLSLMQLFDLLPCTVVNRAKHSTSNDSKLYQRFLAESVGLMTPRTLVSTDPEEVRVFYEACKGEVIYKSLSGVRSIVRRLKPEELGERVNRVRHCPTQFQERVQGPDIRVHVVGEQVFATEMVSEAADYRYADREGASLSARAIEIPDHVMAACFSMTRELGLTVSGIDLRRTPEGDFYCFEVNPSPGFIFYERATGQPISEAVARVLRGDP